MRRAVFCLGATLLAGLLFWPRPVRAQEEEGFADVPRSHWAYQAVTELKRKGILIGYPAPKSTKQSSQAGAQQFKMTEAERIRLEDDIREAVFRYILTLPHWNAANARVCFVGIEPGHKDPDKGFLKRFAGSKPPVKAISEAVPERRGGVKDRATGVRGVEVRIGPVQWITRTQAVVSANAWQGPRDARSGTFRVSAGKHRWIIKEISRPMRVSRNVEHGSVTASCG